MILLDHGWFKSNAKLFGPTHLPHSSSSIIIFFSSPEYMPSSTMLSSSHQRSKGVFFLSFIILSLSPRHPWVHHYHLPINSWLAASSLIVDRHPPTIFFYHLIHFLLLFSPASHGELPSSPHRCVSPNPIHWPVGLTKSNLSNLVLEKGPKWLALNLDQDRALATTKQTWYKLLW